MVLSGNMLRARYDYYLVSLPEKAERPAVAAFRDWLLAEGRNFMAGRDKCFPPSLNEVASNPNLRP